MEDPIEMNDEVVCEMNGEKNGETNSEATGEMTAETEPAKPAKREKVPESVEKITSGGDVNPLQSDPELVRLLRKLDSIKKYKSFQRWKSKFLDRLELFLYEDGMKPAEKAATEFSTLLKKHVKSTEKVLGFIEKGELSDHRKTVKAALSLRGTCTSLTSACTELENLIPSLSREEKKRGYTKFHLGAVLIRQGFHQYISMRVIDDANSEIAGKIDGVLDKQQHELFETYDTKVQRFCDVMADLSLYDVMMKCLEFQEAPEEEESSSEEEVIWDITIEAEDGKVLRLQLDPKETIGNIKDAIAEGSGIEAERQVIRAEGKELGDNNATLEGLGLDDGAVLTLEKFRFPIKVNTHDGKQIKVMVDPTEYLSDIKVQLEKESGVPARNQRIFKGGQELSDNMANNEELGLKAGSVLDMEPKTINITVETPNGQTHTLAVSPSATTDSISEQMSEETGMRPEQQVLKFEGKNLPMGKTLKSLGIGEGSNLSIEALQIPITVRTYDGKTIKLKVEPTDYLSDIKKQLEEESGVDAKNQRLFMGGDELVDMKTVNDCGIKKGAVLDMEPKTIRVTVKDPDGNAHEVEMKPSDTLARVRAKIAEATGIAGDRQVLKSMGKELSGDGRLKDMGIKEGDEISVDYFKLPIKVKTPDERILSLRVEPCDLIISLKKMIQKETGIDPPKQCLKNGEEELSQNSMSIKQCCIVAGSTLVLDLNTDPIIFVDIKCGTLFGMERDDVIAKGALAPYQNNKLDFLEKAKDSTTKDKILKAMKESPTLGVNPQVVVQAQEVEDYDLAEAEAVKNKWGVNLKKREKNKKGEEFLFVDPKTGACGELSRKKYLDMGFITPVTSGKKETLKEAETNHMEYEQYVSEIRRVFGVKVAT